MFGISCHVLEDTRRIHVPLRVPRTYICIASFRPLIPKASTIVLSASSAFLQFKGNESRINLNDRSFTISLHDKRSLHQHGLQSNLKTLSPHNTVRFQSSIHRTTKSIGSRDSDSILVCSCQCSSHWSCVDQSERCERQAACKDVCTRAIPS